MVENLLNDPMYIEFQNEAFDMMEQAENSIMNMDKGTEQREKAYNSVFRVLHSLKGATSMFDLSVLEKLFHAMETDFTNFKYKPMSSNDIAKFLKGIEEGSLLLKGKEIIDKDILESFFDKKGDVATVEQNNKVQKNKKALMYIVDDEEIIAEMLASIMPEEIFECKVFTEPREVLKSVVKDKPEIICSDISMPGMSGIDMINELRERNIQTPVIVISAFVNSDNLAQLSKLGVQSVISKPFDPDDVALKAMSALQLSKNIKFANSTFKVLIHHYTDLMKLLNQEGKSDLAKELTQQVKELIKTKKNLHYYANKDVDKNVA